MRILLIILLFPAIVWAKQIKSEVTYPTADTAVKDGVTYKLIRSSEIYNKIINTDSVITINDKEFKQESK